MRQCRPQPPSFPSYLLSLLVALVLFCQPGCTLRLVSEYDQITDKDVTELNKKFETFITKLERNPEAPSCSHEKNKEFYEKTLVSIRSLVIRNEIRPMNNTTITQLEGLKKSIIGLETAHIKKNDKCFSQKEIELQRKLFGVIFRSILKLELEKKRGDE